MIFATWVMIFTTWVMGREYFLHVPGADFDQGFIMLQGVTMPKKRPAYPANEATFEA